MTGGMVALVVIIVAITHCREKRAAQARLLLNHTSHIIMKPKSVPDDQPDIYKTNPNITKLQSSQVGLIRSIYL